jgi:RND family efflux transporter MFP subunit
VKNKKEKEQLLGLGEKLSEEKLSSTRGKMTKRVLAVIAALVVIGGLYYAYSGFGEGSKYEFVKASVMDIRESVEITGNVEAGATVNLTFRDTGQVSTINYEIGSKLSSGNIIASLKNRDQNLRLQQARANLAGAQANLDEKLAGSRVEDIQIADAGVQKAEAAAEKIAIDWDNAKRELELMKKKYTQDEIRVQLLVDDAKSKYDFSLLNQENTGLTNENAIETAKKDLEAQLYSTGSQIQQSLNNLKSVIVDDGHSVLGNDIVRLGYVKINEAKQFYFEVKNSFDPMYEDFKSQVGYEPAELEAYALKEQEYATKLLHAQTLTLDELSVLNTSSTLSEAKITELKTKISADSNSISTSFASLNLRYQKILDAQLGVVTSDDTKESEAVIAKNYHEQQLQNQIQNMIDHEVDINLRESNIRSLEAQYQVQLADIEAAKATLQQRKVGPRAVDVAFYRTQVTVNQVTVALAEEALEKTLLRAPINGVLSRRNIEVGEDVQSSSVTTNVGEGAFEMISAEKYKIDAEIAEVDINKLNVGDTADITLDAVGSSQTFAGTISTIDPVETLIQDVVFYKAEVVIDDKDERIKPGMTADVNIVLREALETVSIPEKAVQTEEGRRYVRILDGENVKQIDVEVGIRDLQGNVEIKSGLTDGQEIILRTLNGR